jgi:hypothetical protein
MLLGVAILVVTLGLTGCSVPGASSGSSQVSVPVDPGRVARLQVPDGPLVVLPPGSTSGAGRLVAGRAKEAPDPPADLLPVADGAWYIHLKGTKLTGKATLRFPVEIPEGVPAGDVAVLLTYYDRQHQRWRPVASRYDAAGHTVTATVGHLSWWNPLTWDYHALADQASASFRQFVSGSKPAQPRCPNEKRARADGTKVTSDGGSRVKWCYGEKNGKSLLRLVNARGYPALVSYPAGWDAQRQRSGSLAQALGSRLVEATAALPHGRSGVLLDGARQVTLYPDQQPGTTAVVGVKPSSGGYILGDLEYAASTVEFVGGKAPGAPDAARVSTAKLSECIPDLAKTAGTAAVDDATSGLGTDLLRRSLHCVAGKAVARSLAGRFVVSAVNWLADGVDKVVAGGRAIADTLHAPYRISITAPRGRSRPGSTAELSTKGYGPVRFGMTLHEAEQALGAAITTQVAAGGANCLQGTSGAAPGVLFAVVDGHVTAAGTLDSPNAPSAARTVWGLHAGGSLAALKAALGTHLTSRTYVSDADTTEYDYEPPGRQAARFLVTDGKITGILAGEQKQVVGVEAICV